VQLQVVKRDGRREPLERDKIQRALDVSCQKLKISAQDKTALIDAVINEVEAEFEGEVPSTAIGEKVMLRLIKLDEVAYVRFASVYRRFHDVNEFMNEAERVLGRE
jgi:transcriptional repressor NrdR